MLARIAGLLIGAVVLAGAIQNTNGRIEGLVKRADTGAPIPGCSVPASFFDGTSMIMRTGITDNLGRFLLEDLPPGDYSVLHVCSGGYSVPPGGSRSTSVVVGVGQRVSGLTISLLPVEGVISGRVVDEKGNPLAGIRVEAQPLLYTNGRLRLGGTTTTTDDRGNYRFFSLPPGTYYVRTNFNSMPDGNNVSTYYPGVIDAEKAVSIVVRHASEVSGIDFPSRTMSPVTISGRLVLPDLAAVMGGATLEFFLLRRDGRYLDTENVYASTMDNATGAFTIQGRFRSTPAPLPPGSYYLFAWLRDVGTREPVVTSFGLVTSSTRPSDPKFAYFGKAPIEIRSGVNVEGVAIPMLSASAIEGSVTLIEGAKSTAAESLQFYLQPLYLETNNVVPATLFTLLRPIRPNRNGTFTFPKLPEGHYGFEAVGLPEGAYIADIVQGSTSVYDHGIPLLAESTKPVEVVIKPVGATIRGTVLNAEGKSVAHATAVLVPSASRRTNFMLYKTAVADAAGVFTLRGVVPGEYKVFAWEENVSGAFQSPDFIEAYENRGTRVEAREAETVGNVSVRLIPETP